MNVFRALAVFLSCHYFAEAQKFSVIDVNFKKPTKTGTEEVNVSLRLDMDSSGITGKHIDALVIAMQSSFDESNDGKKYHSTGFRADFHDDRSKNEPLPAVDEAGVT